MVKDFKYIVKRILIGTGIALLLMLIRSNVHAQVYTGANGGLVTQVDACGVDVDFTFRNGAQFQGLGSGTLFFNFGLQKVGGTATSMILTPRLVFVTNGQGNVNYVCNMGTAAITNSTYENQIYSVTCPVDSDLSGIGYIHLRFMSNTCPSQYYYNLIIGGSMSFVTEGSDASEINAVNSTMSGVRNDMNNQFNIIGQQQRDIKGAIDNSTQAIEDTKEEIESVHDDIMDDSEVSNSDINDLFGDFTESSTTPVSDLITLPITLMNAYLTGFNTTCSAYNLGTLYGHTITLPCIDIESKLGSGLWGLIDMLFSIFMIYNIAMLFVSIYESITSLDDGFQLLYTPQHAGNSRTSRGQMEGLYD